MYYVVILLISILALLVTDKNAYLKSSFFILLLVSSLRGYEVGGDLVNYIPLFEEIGSHPYGDIFSDYTKYGWCFPLIIKTASLVSGNTSFILFVLSVINLSGVYNLIKRYSTNYWLSIFIYIAFAYYTNTFNSVRSSMALSFGLFAMDSLFRGKNLRFWLISLVAIEIHKTIFPILALPLLYKSKTDFWRLSFAIAFAFVVSRVLDGSVLNSIMVLYSTDYIGFDAEGEGFVLLALYVIFTFGLFFLYKKRMTDTYSMMIKCLCMGVCLQCFAPVASLVTRMTLIFIIYIIILIPNCITLSFARSSRALVAGVVSLLFFLYFSLYVMRPNVFYQDGSVSNSQKTIPYETVWQNNR